MVLFRINVCVFSFMVPISFYWQLPLDFNTLCRTIGERAFLCNCLKCMYSMLGQFISLHLNLIRLLCRLFWEGLCHAPCMPYLPHEMLEHGNPAEAPIVRLRFEVLNHSLIPP